MFIRQNERTFKLILIINSGSMVAHNVCWWSNASCVLPWQLVIVYIGVLLSI